MLFWLTLSSEYQSADDQVAVRHDQWTTTCFVLLAIFSGRILLACERSGSGIARLGRATVCHVDCITCRAQRGRNASCLPAFHFFFHARTWIDQLVYLVPYAQNGRLYEVRFSAEERDFSLLFFGVHPASYSGFNQLHGVSGLRIRGAKPPPTNYLMAWCLMKFNTTFTLISSCSLLRFSSSQFNKYFNVGYTFDHLG